MAVPKIKAAPKQSTSVYRLLSDSGPFTAQQVADQLHILPNTVYRAVKPLIKLGLVEQLNTYPTKFRANSSADAMDWYMRFAVQSFRQDFGGKVSKRPSAQTPTITFIKDRKSLLTIGEEEARKATRSINYIVSGHPVPDSTVLAYKKAAINGVRIRAIVQNKPSDADTDIDLYKYMGAEVRYLPNIGIRLFVFDSKVTILSSYDETMSNQAFGIRFNYLPVAKQLDQLFEQRWEQAQPLD